MRDKTLVSDVEKSDSSDIVTVPGVSGEDY
jgi:hypothetical protein